jgi:hypothetical protein
MVVDGGQFANTKQQSAQQIQRIHTTVNCALQQRAAVSGFRRPNGSAPQKPHVALALGYPAQVKVS